MPGSFAPARARSRPVQHLRSGSGLPETGGGPRAAWGTIRWASALILAVLTVWTPRLAAQALPSFAEPGISPDGAEIAFASGGDIWTVSAEGGAARLLVAHSAHESRPLYSPDGTRLAFNSNRNGGEDVFLMDLATGEVTRLTHDSGSEQLAGWSRDGEWVYFTSGAQDISGRHDVYRVRADGGTPMVVAGDRFESEFFAAPAPEPGLLAISTRHQPEPGEADLPVVRGYPPPAQVVGALFNAIFLDLLDQDALRMHRLNQLLSRLPPEEWGSLRPISLQVIRPSTDLSRIATRFEPRLPRTFRFLTRGLGTRPSRSSDVLSILMFQPDYLQALMDQGEADAEARMGELLAFLDGEPVSHPDLVMG